MRVSLGHGTVELVQGDIVVQHVDAVVNAANTSLLGGGGVDGAIHRAAGAELLAACRELPADERGRRCATGEVRVTPAFRLPARWVIHAVGPVYSERNSERCRALLAGVHRAALEAARDLGARSVAFPAISTGAYRYPVGEAAEVAVRAVADFLAMPSSVEVVRFVLFGPRFFDAWSRALGDATR